jgi:hypothetical protein
MRSRFAGICFVAFALMASAVPAGAAAKHRPPVTKAHPDSINHWRRHPDRDH